MNGLKLPVPDNGASRQVIAGQATYTDPLLATYYWYLGDASGAVKGANIMRVWDDYRGAGVIVAVIDDGVEYTHPDLAANYRSDLDYDTLGLDADPFPGDFSDRHGTAVSGVIAAALNNGTGGAGVAPEAGLVGYRIGFGANGTLEQIRDAFELLMVVDVANNSWGFDGYFGDNFLDPDFAPIGDALAMALAEGRDGLGTIVVMAAGNARTSGQDVNYHGFQNHRGTIAVAATDSGGNVTYYSTPGAALLVAAPGHGITTTDRVGSAGYGSEDYATVNGTSFAAPVVSGIAALMLDANPGLGWRDVQEILAATAVRTGSPASWSFNAADNWNGGAMHVSHDYGFGLVDALAAVRVAESWRSVATSGNEWVAEGLQYPVSPIAIPDGGSVSSAITLAAGLRIDRVEVDLALAHPYLTQLRVTLTAPDGTESVLVHNPSTSQGSIYFTFSTTRDWGEFSGGDWTLTVTDTQVGATGVVYAWGIRAYGDLAGDDTYLYTGEFAALAIADASRRVLSDAGGMDAINTAAIAGDTLLDLRPGHLSLIAGQEVTISAGTIIENADSGDGNDTLIGNDAANSLRGWRGNDFLDGGTGVDTLDGGAGDDVYVVDVAADVIVERPGGGTDTVRTTLASYLLGLELDNLAFIGSGNFKGTGNAAANVIDGGAGNDSLNGGLGADLLRGGLGDDTYTVDHAADSVVELLGEGTDYVYSSVSWTLGANLERLYLTGSAAIDGTGNDLANRLYGQANSAINTLAGGTGNDIYYVGSNDVIVELAGQGTDTAYAYGDFTLAAGVSVEFLYLNVTSGQKLTGNELANYLRGNTGNDTLIGFEGNDSLNGGLGVDLLQGGPGDDTYTVDHSGDSVVELVGEGRDTVYSSVSWTLGANLERLYLTGSVAIEGIGNELANTLVGHSSTAGNVLTGGAGDDAYYVDANDVVVESAGEGNDIVYGSVSWTLGANLERLYLTGSAAVDGTGNDLANRLYGQANSAINTLSGGTGNDIYYVGSNDVIVELAGQGTDTAYGYGDYTLATGVSVENLYLNVTTDQTLIGNELANNLRGNAGSDTLRGLDGNDSLNGGLGADMLEGGQGNDTLAGSFGNDTLSGGNGSDIFRFDTALDATSNLDSVIDFSVVDDSFQLENGIFTSLTQTGTLAAGLFVIGTAALDANDKLIYDNTNGALFYDADGSGSGGAIQFAVLGTSLALTNLDFVVT
jgi:Ca2+-binding RTX toxin-like protein